MNPKRILVVGAGHVGLYAALRLSKKLSSREAEVIVVDPELVTRWLLRVAAVLLGTAVLGVLLLQAAGLGGEAGHQWVTVLGLLVAVGVVALLGWLLRRR